MTALRRVAPSDRTHELMVSLGERSMLLILDPQKGVKLMRLKIKSDHLRVTGPYRMKLEEALAFVKGHAAWVLAHLPPELPPFPVPFVTNTLLHAGAMVPLAWQLGNRPTLVPHENGFLITLPPDPPERWPKLLRSLFLQHWQNTIERSLGQDLAPCVAALGRGPTKVRVRAVQSIWGSLDTKDRITLDLSLALAPPAALRYVWIHELCHLRERNHSARFWAWVDRFCLDRKRQQKWLAGTDGHQIKAQVLAWMSP
jgi:predicted metal-dependent hydrolase